MTGIAEITPENAPKTGGKWVNRIIGTGMEAPDQLLANPKNWRVHPEFQQNALVGVLNEVGWVTEVIVNRRTGNLIDGHLRVEMAMKHGEPAVPVTYVDLSEAEEAKILAVLDPLAALATMDGEKFLELLKDVDTQDEALQQLLDRLNADADNFLPPEEDAPDEGMVPKSFALVVDCTSERDQHELANRLRSEGFHCRVIVDEHVIVSEK